MQTTENLGLRKPEERDFYDVNDFNHNADALDELFEKDENGSVVAKNAKTLDGHEAEYFFPKSGGTINGNVKLEKADSSEVAYVLGNADRLVKITISNGRLGIYDYTNSKWIMLSESDGATTANLTASGNLPLTGGEIKGAINIPLILHNTNDTSRVMQKFTCNNVSFGYLGFNGVDKPVFRDGASTKDYDLLHTGNKPTGTYTGNGSATTRTVNVGGVGNVLAVYGSGAMCIVTSSGVMGGSNGGSTGNYGAASFANGTLTISTDNAMLNKSNVTYTYQVL